MTRLHLRSLSARDVDQLTRYSNPTIVVQIYYNQRPKTPVFFGAKWRRFPKTIEDCCKESAGKRGREKTGDSLDESQQKFFLLFAIWMQD